MNHFLPDLIIEATSVCDRACVGCYAPNVVSKASAMSMYQERPELFLNLSSLNETLSTFDEKSLQLVTVRGGEPTRHPEIASILELCSGKSKAVYLETHGRWIISDESNLLQSIQDSAVTVKISFDKMHGLSANDLKSITDTLDIKSVQYLIAITEATLNDFKNTRALCSWISNDKIIFQQKVFSAKELIEPRLGVVGTSGRINKHLSTRSSLQGSSSQLVTGAV